MKAIFFSINFMMGTAVLVAGFAVLVRATGSHSLASAIVGCVLIGLAAICLGFCKDCMTDKLKKHFRTEGANKV